MRTYSVLLFALAILQSVAIGNCINPISHFLRRGQDNSYAEAYVPTIAPTSVSVDHKAILRGLNSAKRCLGNLATFDTNEYAHFDNPLQLGFIEPPTLSLPAFLLRSKDESASRKVHLSHDAEALGNSRFDFWIPL